MLTEETIEMAKELRNLLGTIEGAKQVQESFTLEYVVVVADEAGKTNVNQVGSELIKQAEKMNISLDIVAATEEEIAEARARLMNSVV